MAGLLPFLLPHYAQIDGGPDFAFPVRFVFKN
jgi:hypothetical protein